MLAPHLWPIALADCKLCQHLPQQELLDIQRELVQQNQYTAIYRSCRKWAKPVSGVFHSSTPLFKEKVTLT
jgi:hypothetical protein